MLLLACHIYNVLSVCPSITTRLVCAPVAVFHPGNHHITIFRHPPIPMRDCKPLRDNFQPFWVDRTIIDGRKYIPRFRKIGLNQEQPDFWITCFEHVHCPSSAGVKGSIATAPKCGDTMIQNGRSNFCFQGRTVFFIEIPVSKERAYYAQIIHLSVQGDSYIIFPLDMQPNGCIFEYIMPPNDSISQEVVLCYFNGLKIFGWTTT